MIPLRDNVLREGQPAVTMLLIVLVVALYLVYPENWPLGLLIADVLVLWLFCPTLEEDGRMRLLGLGALGASIALATSAGLDLALSVAPVGVSGALLVLLATYVTTHIRARVITAVVVPFFFTLVEIPALLFIGGFIAVQAMVV